MSHGIYLIGSCEAAFDKKAQRSGPNYDYEVREAVLIRYGEAV